MGRPLSVTFGDIYMVKMKNDVVIPSKPIFYHRFVDDIYSRQKIGDNVLFDQLNIKLSIEVILVSFWTPNSPTTMVSINPTFIGKTQDYFHLRPPKLQNPMNEIQLMVSSSFKKNIIKL